MIDPAVVAAAAAVRLQVPAADLEEAAAAALVYIAADISMNVADLDPTDALLMIGARLLTERVWLDVPSRAGDLDPFATTTMTGVIIPEDLGRHLRHYWIHQQHRWGIG